MSVGEALEFEAVILSGGVVLFPSDTVYGLACSPEDADAIERLYALKGRAPEKAAAVMFFSLEAALAALGELGERTTAAIQALMPGAVTLLLENPKHRYPLACAADPATLGVRVVDVPLLHGVGIPVLQSSANRSGEADARTLAAVAPAIRAGAGLVIDGGELPGVPSTVVDLRRYERDAEWSIVRQGLVESEAVAGRLDGNE
jgi:L-threonylcarbamoyladenylate synthase